MVSASEFAFSRSAGCTGGVVIPFTREEASRVGVNAPARFVVACTLFAAVDATYRAYDQSIIKTTKQMKNQEGGSCEGGDKMLHRKEA